MFERIYQRFFRHGNQRPECYERFSEAEADPWREANRRDPAHRVCSLKLGANNAALKNGALQNVALKNGALKQNTPKWQN